jgi:hypothetical protein
MALSKNFTGLHFKDRTPSAPFIPFQMTEAPFGWNYKPAEKHCWLIFLREKKLFRLKKQAE